MKRVLLIIITIFLFGSIRAQDKSGLGPTKGTVTASLIFGKASTFANSITLPEANLSTYTVSSPSFVSNVSENSLVNMIGVEGKWFFSNTWALRLNGSTMLDVTPSREGTPGIPSTVVMASIPTYNEVPSRANAEVIINAGVDKYFATKNEHLFWYASPVVNFQYGRKTGYELGSLDPTTDPGTTRYAEAYAFGLSGVAGCEYYSSTGFVFGFEIRGASAIYSVNSILPVEGMKPLRSDNYNFSFLSQPTVKIGFKF